MSTVDQARDKLSAANTRLGAAHRAWQTTGQWDERHAYNMARDDVVVAEMDLVDAMRADGEIE